MLVCSVGYADLITDRGLADWNLKKPLRPFKSKVAKPFFSLQSEQLLSAVVYEPESASKGVKRYIRPLKSEE